MTKYQIPLEVLESDIRSWGQFAACKGKPSILWFADNYANSQGRVATREAKAICSMCIVRNQCLQHALDNDESFGIWGGKTPQERGYRREGRARRTDVVVQD
jgi:hypothetical protein